MTTGNMSFFFQGSSPNGRPSSHPGHSLQELGNPTPELSQRLSSKLSPEVYRTIQTMREEQFEATGGALQAGVEVHEPTRTRSPSLVPTLTIYILVERFGAPK